MKTIPALLAVLVALSSLASTLPAAERRKTENVFLITSDGLRWQELFTGAEKELISEKVGGVVNVRGTRQAYWRDTPEERREALMPFMWNVIAKQGQIYGNQTKGNIAHITNKMRFSYPGYNEILTGSPDPAITSNDRKPNKNVTVLEWLHNKPAFKGKVAAYSAWNVMPSIINRQRAGFAVMGGWEPLPEKDPNPRQQLLNDLIATATPANNAEVFDAILHQAALEHIKRHTPRVMLVSYLETDHWAHARRYDLTLRAARSFDSYVRNLWETVQSMPQYKDKTTFILATDHGRGNGAEWTNHQKNVEGAQNIWIAAIGPDTPPLGERTHGEAVTQSQIAATIAALLGEDYKNEVPAAGNPIEDLVGSARLTK